MPSVPRVGVADEVGSSLKVPTAFLGPPPLVRGESPDDYSQFLDRVMLAVQPQDVFEDIWVRQVVDQVWEAQRLRRAIAGLVTITQQEALLGVLRELLHGAGLSRAPQLAKDYFSGDKNAITEVDRLLKSADRIWDVITAKAMALRIDEIERLTGMLMKAEGRVADTLREIERHRSTLGKQLKAAWAIESKAAPSLISETETEEGSDGVNAQD